jgi:hypothetical protein
MARTSPAVRARGSSRATFWSRAAALTASSMFWLSLEAAPSVPTPTGCPPGAGPGPGTRPSRGACWPPGCGPRSRPTRPGRRLAPAQAGLDDLFLDLGQVGVDGPAVGLFGLQSVNQEHHDLFTCTAPTGSPACGSSSSRPPCRRSSPACGSPPAWPSSGRSWPTSSSSRATPGWASSSTATSPGAVRGAASGWQWRRSEGTAHADTFRAVWLPGQAGRKIGRPRYGATLAGSYRLIVPYLVEPRLVVRLLTAVRRCWPWAAPC